MTSYSLLLKILGDPSGCKILLNCNMRLQDMEETEEEENDEEGEEDEGEGGPPILQHVRYVHSTHLDMYTFSNQSLKHQGTERKTTDNYMGGGYCTLITHKKKYS